MFLAAVVVGILAEIIALYGFTPLWRFGFWKHKRRKSPIVENLLAYPGRTLMNNVQDAWWDSAFGVMLLALGPAALSLIYVWCGGIVGSDPSFLLFVAIVLTATAAGCLALRRKLRQVRDWRLGLDGERAVGEELNQLMRYGFYVFHDFPAGRFNIDHVVIGPSGVFAVETKARSKAIGKGKEGAKVVLNGKTLQFPNGLDQESIPQAEDEAKWLAAFLKKSVGKPIPVFAVLALPGWFIERGPHDGSVLVINPKNPEKFFPKRAAVLDDQTIQQVVFQVEQKCRTVEPFDPF